MKEEYIPRHKTPYNLTLLMRCIGNRERREEGHGMVEEEGAVVEEGRAGWSRKRARSTVKAAYGN